MRCAGKISIILPTHKSRVLWQVTEAVYASTYKNFELIIVDENKERSTQRNIGIDRATGKYLLFLDSDMVISQFLLEDCMDKIQIANGVYILEIIKTKGLFGKIRNWERQFYTATSVDCVRFVKAENCPRFDETMSGPEDSDWDRQIPQPKIVSSVPYYHYEDIGFFDYFHKKAYYARSMKRFAEKNPNDKLLNFWWRCFGVFLENGKWKKFLAKPHFAIAVFFIIFVRGIIYLWNGH